MGEWTDSQNLGVVQGDPIKGELEQKPGEPLSDEEVTRRADAQAAKANAEQPTEPAAEQPAVEPAATLEPDEVLLALTRPQLNARALELGVNEPEKLQNKGAVVEAIKAAASGGGG